MTYNESSYKSSQKYKSKNIKRIPLDVSIAQYEAIKAHADARGEKVNSFIKRAILEAMERDKGE